VHEKCAYELYESEVCIRKLLFYSKLHGHICLGFIIVSKTLLYLHAIKGLSIKDTRSQEGRGLSSSTDILRTGRGEGSILRHLSG